MHISRYLYMVYVQVGLVAAYRFDLLFGWFFRLFQFFAYFSLWSLTVSDTVEYNRLLVYYALTFLLLEPIQSGKLASRISQVVVTGELNKYLIRPINYPLTEFIETLSKVMVRIVVPVIFLIVVALIYPEVFAPKGIVNLVLFVAITVIVFVLWNLMMFLQGLAAFWLGEIRYLITVNDLIMQTLKGVFIPLYLFPDQIRNILELTPFGYLISFPISVYTGEISIEQFTKGLFVLLIWIIIFYELGQFTFSRAIRKYEAAGS